MGVNYDQKCMVGIEIYVSDIKVIIEEAVYENQNRYDSRTGKITKTERVLVKEEDAVYVLMGKKYSDRDSLAKDIAEDLGLDYSIEDDYFYIGEFVGEENGMGNVDMLTGSVEISYLVKLMTELKDKLPGDISLHFLSSAG